MVRDGAGENEPDRNDKGLEQHEDRFPVALIFVFVTGWVVTGTDRPGLAYGGRLDEPADDYDKRQAREMTPVKVEHNAMETLGLEDGG